jgi:hypothetical protein
MEADHIILQAQVNGREPIGFLVDTGDGHETINVARASVFGLSNHGSTASYGGGNLAQLSLAYGTTFTFPKNEIAVLAALRSAAIARSASSRPRA